MSKNTNGIMADSDVRKLVSFLKNNEQLTDLEAHIMCIFSVDNAIKRASKYGYKIEKKHIGALWNRSTVYYMKKQK